MPPRLLDKRVVNQELALEKKNQIEKGLTLAKKVDAVRETLNQEETRLEEFRQQSIRRAQIEIDAKIREREELETGNKELRKQRILAQAPINLKEEWSKIREDQSQLKSWEERLGQQSIGLLAKEEDTKVLQANLAQWKDNLAAEQVLTAQNLTEAEQKFNQGADALERAENQSQKLLQEAEHRLDRVKIREEDATNREMSLSKREEQVNAHEIDLSNREKKLKLNQELFIKAQKYVNSKKKR